MLEMTGIADMLRGVAVLYWVVAAVCLIIAIRRPRTWGEKALWVAVVVAVFGVLPVQSYLDEHRRAKFREEANNHFGTRCLEYPKEFIKRKVEGVDGFLLLRPRAMASSADFRNQFWMGDPYGYDLSPSSTAEIRRHVYGYLGHYKYVEERFEAGEGKYRYVRYSVNTLLYPEREEVLVESIATPAALYGLDWEDVSTTEDRKYWVAGGRVRIVELASQEVIAEHVGYMGDPKLGAGGTRYPWTDALTRGAGYCRGSTLSGSNVKFALRVLIPNEKKEARDGK